MGFAATFSNFPRIVRPRTTLRSRATPFPFPPPPRAAALTEAVTQRGSSRDASRGSLSFRASTGRWAYRVRRQDAPPERNYTKTTTCFFMLFFHFK